MSNYHYYLKQELIFTATTPPVAVVFDAEAPLRLFVLLAGACCSMKLSEECCLFSNFAQSILCGRMARQMERYGRIRWSGPCLLTVP